VEEKPPQQKPKGTVFSAKKARGVRENALRVLTGRLWLTASRAPGYKSGNSRVYMRNCQSP
jgi:hypothetical protein